MSKQTSNIPTPNYFTDVKKGEVNELLTLLQSLGNERDPKKKREPVKKVRIEICYEKWIWKREMEEEEEDDKDEYGEGWKHAFAFYDSFIYLKIKKE